MAGKRKSTPVRGIIVYLLLVIVTGCILKATGHFDSPFTAMEDTIATVNMEAALSSNAPASEGAASETSRDAAAPDTQADSNSTGVRSEDAGKSGSPEDHSGTQVHKDGSTTEGDPTTDHTEAESIQWSRFADVFFDLWFIALVTAVIIVVQQLFSFASRRWKKRLHPALTH